MLLSFTLSELHDWYPSQSDLQSDMMTCLQFGAMLELGSAAAAGASDADLKPCCMLLLQA